MLMRHEGERLRVYDDATGKPIGSGDTLIGHPTIGVGRALDVNGLSHDESMYLLHSDVNRWSAALRATYAWFPELSAPRQDAIIDMVHNLGLHGFAQFRQMIGHLERKEWSDAAKQGLDSHWATQVGARANELMAMIETGQYQT